MRNLARVARTATNRQPLWYQEAIIYELHVRAFCDSTGSGTGDFSGLTQKLDYIQELGVTALWLLPFCPSPWRDDGYDVADYSSVHPAYGCVDDFQRFMEECKRRSLHVITELVLNHTSDSHPWFERARNAPAGSRWRDFYVWSDSPDRFSEARIIFSDFETSNWTWDSVAQAYYWHRFFSHQPDLNFHSADVRQSVFETIDFWLQLGVDGLRLDAVPYLFEREGTNCENLPETHEFLRELRRYVDTRYPGRMLLAEANQWPEDAAAYFGHGDECHMAFHFPLMPRLFMATRMEDSFPIINIIEQTPKIPENCQWATFLRNHDELTLEMVCEEERDYMYRVYGHDPEMRINIGIRRRLAPLVENDRRRIELLNALLLSLPGTPVIYYGDEIGMGDNLRLGDRNGVRTPMQWNADRNAGFSEADPESLYLPVISKCEYDYRFVNVEAQQHLPHSLLWWMRRAIAARRNSGALTRGSIQFLHPANRHVLAFVRKCGPDVAIVVANLSRSAQPARLRLTEYAGATPVEMFGRVEFPPIEDDEYLLTLPPYGYYWFTLRQVPSKSSKTAAAAQAIPVSHAAAIFEWKNRAQLGAALLPFLKAASRFDPRTVTGAEVADLIHLNGKSVVAVIEVFFGGGDPELQFVPLALIHPRISGEVVCPEAASPTPLQTVATLQTTDGDQVCLAAGSADGALTDTMLDLISQERSVSSHCGSLTGFRVGPFARGVVSEDLCLVPQAPATEQRNTSVSLGQVYVLKLLRRLEAGAHPDIDVVRFLFERAGFTHVAPAVGYLEYAREDGEPAVAGVLHAYVDHRHDLWEYTLDQLHLFLDRAAASRRDPVALSSCHPMDVRQESLRYASELVQIYVEDSRLLGQRLAEMHTALGTDDSDPLFAPEPFTSFYQRGRYHFVSGTMKAVLQSLRERQSVLAEGIQAEVSAALALETRIRGILGNAPSPEDAGLRIRVHGDLHLGQILHAGHDLVFIDFEGDSALPLHERVLKRSPLMDVAGLLLSMRYAASSVIIAGGGGLFDWRAHQAELEAWVRLWLATVTNACLTAYRAKLQDSPLPPSADDDFRRMLDIHLVGKAVYQTGYDLQNRPEWLPVALRTLREVVLDAGYARE